MARILIAALVAATLAASGCGGDDDGETAGGAAETEAAGAGEFVTFDLEELANSGVETGTASLTAEDGSTRVVVEARPDAEEGDTESPPHPVHVHAGSCDDLGEVVHPLTDLTGGLSQTVVDAPLSELLDGDFAINLHKSADEIDVYIACGDIPDEPS